MSEAELHRRLAVELFNRTWDLLEAPRTRADDAGMVHAAHASRHHWAEAGGTPAHLARGEWLIARVYAAIGRPEPAMWHARLALEAAERGGEGFEDWDLAAAMQAMAGAHLVAGDREAAAGWGRRCREALRGVADPEDRAVVQGHLDELALPA